ncbi:MAG: hypothetical protein J0M18_00455 [Ignavibacteria bacterium]|jgi:hypothetical protein|nr:hypothetical protein [Ignavibacteria bacterium]
MKNKRNSPLILSIAFSFILVIFFIALYIASNRPKPIIEQKKINIEIDTIGNYNHSIEINRIIKKEEDKRKEEQLQKDYQDKVLKQQIENDKKEMEYLNKRYLEPYKKK